MEQDFSFVFDAMQKYRMDGAIGFAEWITKSNWIPDPFQVGLKNYRIWAKMEKGEWTRSNRTTEQLYEEYIKQKYKKEFVPKKPPQVKNLDGSGHNQYA